MEDRKYKNVLRWKLFYDKLLDEDHRRRETVIMSAHIAYLLYGGFGIYTCSLQITATVCCSWTNRIISDYHEEYFVKLLTEQ